MEHSTLIARSHRILSLVSKASVTVHDAQNGDMLLLEVSGDRTVKCPRKVFDGWRREELVKVTKRNQLVVTSVGSAWLKRNGAASPRQGFVEQHQKHERATADVSGARQQVLINLDESPLGRLRRLKDASGQEWITSAELMAAERLRADFEKSQLTPNISANLDPAFTASSRSHRHADGFSSISDVALAARRRLTAAMDAVGPELSGLLLDVCCFLKGMERVEQERKWPRRSAKILLKAALGSLSRHYHPVAVGPTSHGHPLHWATDDYRPEL